MFNIKEYFLPNTLEEAYDKLCEKKFNVLLGGTTFLRMGERNINCAIDLENLGLDKIEEFEDRIEIGAYVSYYDLETSKLLNKLFDGVLAKCVKSIIGTQFRRLVRVGSSVYAKYGFSDFIPTLLTLDTKVVLYKEGEMSLEEFLSSPSKRDILTKIIISKKELKAKYDSLRLTSTDFPIINVAFSISEERAKISVGARPSVGKLAKNTSNLLYKMYKKEIAYDFELLGKTLDEEIEYSTNARASDEYRKHVAKVLLERMIKELFVC